VFLLLLFVVVVVVVVVLFCSWHCNLKAVTRFCKFILITRFMQQLCCLMVQVEGKGTIYLALVILLNYITAGVISSAYYNIQFVRNVT
jgi:hypothetical protein